MIARLVAALILSLPLAAAAGRSEIRLPAPDAKEPAAKDDERGRLRVGAVRPLAKAARAEGWTQSETGFVTTFSATSEGAMGLRARLDLASFSGTLRVRVQGDGGRIETMAVDAAKRSEVWTPWTEGATQTIEIASATLPPGDAVSLGAVVHFTDSPFAKAAAVCTIPTSCATNNAALDAAVQQTRRAVAKMTFVEGGQAFVCTGTLVNTERFPAPFFLTANHCIDSPAVAATLATFWFYESSCDAATVDPGVVQLPGGAELVFANQNVDGTLLKLNDPAPNGAVYAKMSATPMSVNAPMVSISHPHGDTGRLAWGNISMESKISEHAQHFLFARFSNGIVEGGSSGSALLALVNGTLEVRGTLFGTTLRQPGGMSCTDTSEEAIYGRMEVFLPQIGPFIKSTPPPADDAPNRPQDFFTLPFADPNGVDKPLDLRGTTLEFNNQRLDYAGDMDVYRFRMTAAGYVSAWSEGSLDTVGAILDSQGRTLVSNDNAQYGGGNLNFGITQRLAAGTYYLQVGHYEPDGTGAYSVRLRAENVGTNYTDLWWNPAEGGWGVNVNHQDNTLFATLFTYDASGAGMWLSMSGGARQADGSYLGDLYRTTGPAFNSGNWAGTPINYTKVGTMRFAFTDPANGTLVYTVNGAQVSKVITRISFSTPPLCSWDRGDRSFSFNFQDLWWNAAESGWGINITHQGDTLFATLFTYDAQGQPMWLVMSNGARSGSSDTYEGDLFRTTGPAFNAVPFTPIGPPNYTTVGRMSFQFTTGNQGLLFYTVNGASVSKSIERLTFGALRTSCDN